MILVIPKKELFDNHACYTDGVGYFVTDGKTYNFVRDSSDLTRVLCLLKNGDGWKFDGKPTLITDFLKKHYPEVFL